jgi:hypothetical protein
MRQGSRRLGPSWRATRLATSFLDDQDERIDVSRMLDMAAMRAVMRRFGKLGRPRYPFNAAWI